MNLVGAFRPVLAHLLRVFHIALWLTIPTTFWLWLWSEPPAECVPEYGWYQGNVLCVSEDAHIFLALGLLLIGFFGFCFWIAGYCLEAVGRATRGEKRLPPVRLASIRPGCGVVWSSFKFWLPAIAYLIGISIYGNTLHLPIRNQVHAVLLVTASPVLLAMFWGNIVGAARYAVHGERSLVCRRRENMRLALTKLRSSIALTVFLVFATIGCAFAMARMEFLAITLEGSDPMVEAAVGSFVFFFSLLAWSIVCSRLVAGYARRIGIGNRLSSGAKLG